MNAAPPTAPVAAAPPSVLLVDDEAELREVIREVLAMEFEVETAASTQEAETLLARRTFDVMICDHVLPAGTGLDFFIRHYGRWPGMKRILLTGYMNPELISRSVALGGLVACVLKPVAFDELLRLVRGAVAK